MPKNRNHTGRQSSSPWQEPRKVTKPEACSQVHAQGSNARAHNQTNNLQGKRLCKRRAGSGHLGQRLAPNDLGEVDETSPPVASSREGDNSTKPELNHAQRTKRGTGAYGNPGPVPSSKKSASSSGEDKEDTGSSSADSVQIKSALSPDVH